MNFINSIKKNVPMAFVLSIEDDQKLVVHESKHNLWYHHWDSAEMKIYIHKLYKHKDKHVN
jgi:hypothetical protein